MMKKLKKVLSACFLIALLCVPSIICLASSTTYNTTFSFSGCVLGQYRDYNYGDITVTTVSTQKTWGTLYEDTFTVSLYREGLVSDKYIGKYNAKCEGTTTNGWSNMLASSYRLELNKNKRDGQLLEGTMKIVNKTS